MDLLEIEERAKLEVHNAYQIQHQKNESMNLLQGGWLIQQFIVNAYATIEEQVLTWFRDNVETVR